MVLGIDLLLGQGAVPYAHLGHVTGEETVGIISVTDPEGTVPVALTASVCHTQIETGVIGDTGLIQKFSVNIEISEGIVPRYCDMVPAIQFGKFQLGIRTVSAAHGQLNLVPGHTDVAQTEEEFPPRYP